MYIFQVFSTQRNCSKFFYCIFDEKKIGVYKNISTFTYVIKNQVDTFFIDAMQCYYHFLWVCTLLAAAKCSPFQLTEKYIAEFQEGIAGLQKLSHEYEYHPEDFTLEAHNLEGQFKTLLFSAKENNMTQIGGTQWPLAPDNSPIFFLSDAEEFDFVIVGGGSSGAVIANRLSQIPEWKVLLLESGAPESKITQIPAMHRTLQTTPYNWWFTTVPQNKSCLGTNE